MEKDTLSLIFTGVLVFCALIITGLVIQREFVASPAEPSFDVDQQYENWQDLADAGNQVGSRTAPVQLIKFYDYECSFCKRSHDVLNDIKTRYPDEVAITYRHFPLDEIHDQARPAAHAVECAAEQDHFLEYHDAIFAHSEPLGESVWVELASSIGLPNLEVFSHCIENREQQYRIEEDIDAANKVQVQSIPTFLVNGNVITGAVPFDRFEELIQEHL